MASEGGVLIGNDQCSIRLVCAGPNVDITVPANISVRAGPFTGVLHDDLTILGFYRQVVALHKNRVGEAELAGREHFSLYFVGDDKGGINVVVALAEEEPWVRLEFEFSIDQSCLPGIIRQLDAEFLVF